MRTNSMKSNLITHLFFFLVLFGSCQRSTSNESKEDGRTLILNLDEQVVPLNSSNKVKLLYSSRQAEPIEINSIDDNLAFPTFDSTMAFFRIEFDTFNLEFSGDFLLYELPHILKQENDTLYLDIDTEPFTSKNIYPTETTEYIIGLYYNEERTNGAW